MLKEHLDRLTPACGLGNERGQLGKHLMTKMWADAFGFFPDIVFNGHTGPAAQMWGLDDFIATDFDAPSSGAPHRTSKTSGCRSG